MQFIYDLDAQKECLKIKNENYRYLFKVRRLKVGDIVNFRNLNDEYLYRYEVACINKKEAVLKLLDFENYDALISQFHLLWCFIEPKVIYATLPMLNQLGVSKISFIYCDRSQKNFKIDLKKVQNILINSCQQSGRPNLMQIEILNNLDELIQKDEKFSVLDFGGEKECNNAKSVLVGCEGGFSKDELKKLQNIDKIGFKTQNILKSETASIAIVTKVLI